MDLLQKSQKRSGTVRKRCVNPSYPGVSRLSNEKMEGTNNKIKLVKRHAYGYRNLERFFLNLLLEPGRKIATTCYGDEPYFCYIVIFLYAN
ncbi:transposase [Exiguobacterium sp. S22-S28]|uniref:transposase n=1 Tax=Exiguobacterium sp. S22-S28 TaxID=3342768 RepID=UPI00372D6949